ncbi:MAG TPA: ATP synthase F1 subunit epsilon [Candidatus Borkfalkia excrementavium]|uniref:ATP synthase epsilon chain n=1 Tax=Candidatus Borkfalkia excrementavium TaxID=2838505 RepID=A0A9D1Z721_9FIRM|nr:ATP synthase F1 subunit epsilon [Candidatus Borkfalkia excrementavium]
MSKFLLEIITPEKQFFKGEVESINIPSLGGACTIMAGHQPMVFATEPGMITIVEEGRTREAFMSEGFIEVRPDETIAFSEAVEWPEDIDERRAKEAKERAEEMLRRNRSAAEYKLNRIALQRAFARLRVKHHGDAGWKDE